MVGSSNLSERAKFKASSDGGLSLLSHSRIFFLSIGGRVHFAFLETLSVKNFDGFRSYRVLGYRPSILLLFRHINWSAMGRKLDLDGCDQLFA